MMSATPAWTWKKHPGSAYPAGTIWGRPRDLDAPVWALNRGEVDSAWAWAYFDTEGNRWLDRPIGDNEYLAIPLPADDWQQTAVVALRLLGVIEGETA